MLHGLTSTVLEKVKAKWWVWLGLFAWELLKDRLFGWSNQVLDNIAPSLPGTLTTLWTQVSWLFPLGLPATFAILFVATLVALAYRDTRAAQRRSPIEIQFDSTAPVYVVNMRVQHDPPGPALHNLRWFRIGIHNPSNTTVDDVELRLLTLEPAAGHRIRLPVRLRQSDTTAPARVHPDGTMFFDFLAKRWDQDAIQVNAEPESLVATARRYEGTIGAFARDVVPVMARFVIELSEDNQGRPILSVYPFDQT